MLGLPRPLSSCRRRALFAVRPTPLDAFGQFDIMNILEVEFQLEKGWKGPGAFPSRVCAFYRFVTVQQIDVPVKMCFPFLPVKELLHTRGSWKRHIPQAERAIPRAGEGSAVDEGIALDGKRVRPSQVEFAVIVPVLLADNPLIVVKT